MALDSAIDHLPDVGNMVSSFIAPLRERRCDKLSFATGDFQMFLLLTSVFILFAAIAPQSILNEILGWTGIVCFHICVFCGLRYALLNR